MQVVEGQYVRQKRCGIFLAGKLSRTNSFNRYMEVSGDDDSCSQQLGRQQREESGMYCTVLFSMILEGSTSVPSSSSSCD